MKKNCLFLAFLIFVPFAFAAPPPMSQVKETIEKLKTETRREAIRQIILERMDFEEMAKRSLGMHWRAISEAEQKEFVKVFSRFVEVFYRSNVLNSLQHIGKVEINYFKERIDGDFAEVEVKIKTPQDEFQMLYKLRLSSEKWKAYDIVVEGVSIVSSYRSQFDRIIRKYDFAALMERLREKTKELDT